MQKRKGFTLVELVIVIAVIAILAGVLIGTFASVINRANESARLQEIKAQEIQQKADDILKKIEDSNWYGWEDFETSIVDKLTTVITSAAKDNNTVEVKLDSAAVEKAVSQAMAKFYAENAMGNTGLTEEQVKAIVENALGSFKYEGVTAEQVTTIVNTAVSKIQNELSENQVKTIVDAAVAKVEAGQLSSAQITTIVSNALASNNGYLTSSTETAVEKVIAAINAAQASQLTEKQVEDIITKALKATGNTNWVDPTTYASSPSFKISTSEEVTGLATLVNGGYDFEGKTITLKGEGDTNTITLDSKNWTPIGNSYDTQFKGTLKGESETNPLVIDGLTLNEQLNAVLNGFLIKCDTTGNMDKVGVGFVAYLGEGAVLENILFTNVDIKVRDTKMDGISVGVAVGYLDGGTLRNVKVDGGTISSVYRVGGLCGAAAYGTIEKCKVENVTIESVGYDGKMTDGKGNWVTAGYSVGAESYHSAGGLVGYLRQFTKDRDNHLTVDSCVVNNVTLVSVAKTTAQDAWTVGNPAIDTNKNTPRVYVTIKNTGNVAGAVSENTLVAAQ